MIFRSYEFHLMSKLHFSEMMAKLATAGYKYKVGLIKGEEGVEIYLMNGNISIEAMIKMYGEQDGYYIYEVKVKTKDDFMKLHDIMAAI